MGKDFVYKMNTYKPGKYMTSRTFYIGENSFRLEIYPNGETYEDRGNVSVFLTNMSDWRVQADCEFSVKNYCQNTSDYVFYVKRGRGFRKYLPHIECQDLLDDNKTFVLKAAIKVLEEVTGDRKLTAYSVVGLRVECLEEIKKLKTEMNTVKTEILNMKSLVQNNNTEMDSLRRSVETIKISNQIGHNPNTECPVCLEIVRRPMRLMQCGMGHILCDGCYSKSREEARGREEGVRDIGRCHSCMGEYTGRPAHLERMLGLLD